MNDMISRHLKTALMVSTIITCGFASESFAAADQKVVATIVANLNLKDGTTLQFQDAGPGGLTVMVQGRAGSGGAQAATVNGVSTEKLSRLNAVDLYKAVTGGSAAPAALVAAQGRADAASKQAATSAAPNDIRHLPAKQGKSLGTASGWSYSWSGISGSYYYSRCTYYYKTYVSVYSGYPSMYQYVTYWNGSAWVYNNSQWVGGGNYGTIYQIGGTCWKRADTKDYYGSYYNRSIYGY